MSSIFIAIPLTIFLLFVAPLWLWLHYNNSNKTGQQLSSGERQKLLQLTQDAEQMGDRIKSLEQILDAEHKGWRNN